MIELDALSRRYGRTIALDDVTLNIAKGEVFGLLGANGAGKTTLLSVLAGLLRPTGGDARVDGASVKGARNDVKHLVGIVPQHLSLYPALTPRENLRFFARVYGVPRGKVDARVTALLKEVGLSNRADDPAGDLSGGLKQRLNIAAALVHDPKVVLLDEPSTGLDPAARARVWELIQGLRARGRTLIVSTHYMDEARALCDRVALLERGRLATVLAKGPALDDLERRFSLEGIPGGVPS